MILLFFFIFIVASADLISKENTNNKVIVNYEPYEATWEIFKRKYDRHYSKSEDADRYAAFVAKVKKIEAHNKDYLAGRTSFYMHPGPFADRTNRDPVNHCSIPEDSSRRHRRSDSFCQGYKSPKNFKPPEKMDWRVHEAVTPVKDQGQCGSCYAFGVTAGIEAQAKFITGILTPLSEQQIVDCHYRHCGGSNADNAFRYVSQHGLMSERDHPYAQKTLDFGEYNLCQINHRIQPHTKISGCLRTKGEDMLKLMVAAEGPVYVAIAVLKDDFQHYGGGVYHADSCNEKHVNFSGSYHCLAVVGYGHDPNARGGPTDYWAAKNSWNETWGVGGYVYIRRGENTCGIGDNISVPVLGGKSGRATSFKFDPDKVDKYIPSTISVGSCRSSTFFCLVFPLIMSYNHL